MKPDTKSQPNDAVIDTGYLPAVTSVAVGGDPCSLIVMFDDGHKGVVDLSGIIHKRQALAALRDEDEFAKVHIINDGDGVAWDAGPDFSADGLRHLAK